MSGRRHGHAGTYRLMASGAVRTKVMSRIEGIEAIVG
jgi:hypothetical protein